MERGISSPCIYGIRVLHQQPIIVSLESRQNLDMEAWLEIREGYSSHLSLRQDGEVVSPGDFQALHRNL